jgi:hypothetical protein
MVNTNYAVPKWEQLGLMDPYKEDWHDSYLQGFYEEYMLHDRSTCAFLSLLGHSSSFFSADLWFNYSDSGIHQICEPSSRSVFSAPGAAPHPWQPLRKKLLKEWMPWARCSVRQRHLHFTSCLFFLGEEPAWKFPTLENAERFYFWCLMLDSYSPMKNAMLGV